MALIKCPECGASVSDRAQSCPRCSCPLGNGIGMGATQTIEKTGKKWKGIILVFGAIIGLGVLVMVGGNRQVGGGLLGIGLVGFLAARIGAWWQHG